MQESTATSGDITNEAIWGKLLEIESHIAGRGVDLLTPNHVYRTYQVTQYRLHAAVEAGHIKAYDNGRSAEGGGISYKVRRADVIRYFQLPPLPPEGEPVGAGVGKAATKRGKRR